MTFTAHDSFTTIPGTIYTGAASLTANRNWLITNTALALDDVRLWGTFLIQIYSPPPVDEVMTVFSHNCYTRNEAIFDPTPYLGELGIYPRFYAGVNTKPIDVIIWTE